MCHASVEKRPRGQSLRDCIRRVNEYFSGWRWPDRSASGTARSRHEIRYFCGHCSGCLTFGSYTHDGRARCSSPRCARREGCLASCCPHPPCSPFGLRAACLPQASGSAPCSHVLGRLSG